MLVTYKQGEINLIVSNVSFGFELHLQQNDHEKI